MLRRRAFASLQHGFLRSVKNVFLINFVTPNGVWENVLLYNIDACFLYNIDWQMLCLIVSWQMLLPYKMWQMLLPLRKMLSSYFCEWQMLLPYGVEDVIPLYSMLQHIVLADVFARWQMEQPTLYYC